MEKLLNCDGRRFRANIDGVECEGKVRVEDGRVYLCQNKKNGCGASNKYGYKYSWMAHLSEDGSIDPSYSVHDFQLLLPSTPAEIEAYKDWTVGNKIQKGTSIWEVIFRSGKLVVLVDDSGNATSNYTCDELYNNGWRLVAEEDRDVHESGKTDTYKPKAGDLVFVETFDKEAKFILIYGANEYTTPSLKRGLSSCRDTWRFHDRSAWAYSHIRPATAEEAALFTRILAENGYEYDPEKKEVRKKRWRAKTGEEYYYVSMNVNVYTSWHLEKHDSIDDALYDCGNYFRTREKAEAVAAEFREILNKRK